MFCICMITLHAQKNTDYVFCIYMQNSCCQTISIQTSAQRKADIQGFTKHFFNIMHLHFNNRQIIIFLLCHICIPTINKTLKAASFVSLLFHVHVSPSVLRQKRTSWGAASRAIKSKLNDPSLIHLLIILSTMIHTFCICITGTSFIHTWS